MEMCGKEGLKGCRVESMNWERQKLRICMIEGGEKELQRAERMKIFSGPLQPLLEGGVTSERTHYTQS